MEQDIFVAQPVDLFASDGDVAKRALKGDPVVILPKGEYWRWDEQYSVDDETLDEFVTNWNQRAERGLRQTRLAVDIDHDGRAVGWYDEVMKTEAGLAARFTWTQQGQKVLENGEYAYFSPTVWWQMRDRKTNEIVYNQIAGGALTNYPFFGDDTALYNVLRRRTGGTMENQLEDVNPKLLEQFWGWLTQRASSVDAHPPAEHSAGPDTSGLDEVRAEMAQLRDEYAAQIAEVRQERDQYARHVGDLKAQLGMVTDARASERFSRMAQEYAHLPVATADLASELRWLYSADTDAEQPHAGFFARLLSKADQSFAEAFAAQGHGQRMHSDALEQIETRVADYRRENPGVAYNDALSAVLRADPQLYALYNRQREEV